MARENLWASGRVPRDDLIRLRVTPAEKTRAIELAQNAGFNRVSAYIRWLLEAEDDAATEGNPK